MNRTLRTPAELEAAGLLPAGAAAALAPVAERYAVAVTPAVAALIAAGQADVAAQYLPDRALLKPLLACPVYCRFCFRREAVGPEGGLLSAAELEAALDWFARTPAVREAILTGGDPLMLSGRRLGDILARLAALPHIELLRIHSRVPVADPDRVNSALCAALDVGKPLYLCVHANAAAEFTEAAGRALRALHGAGAVLLGQSVLLRGVNDSTAALEALFRAMLRHRVKPYYLHQLDPAPGTARFHVPVAEGLRLLAALRGRVSGLAWPTYVQEAPAGGGKFPLGMPLMREGAGLSGGLG
jgi:lysine 2,3-aminomutase